MLIPASAPTSSVQTSNYTSCCLQIKMLMTMMMLMMMFMLMIKMTVSVCCVLGGRGGQGAAYKWDSRVWEPTPLSFDEPWLDLTALLIIFKVKPDQRHQVEMATIDQMSNIPVWRKLTRGRKIAYAKSQITPSQGQGHLVFPGDKRYTVQGDKKRPSLLPPFLQLSGPAPLLLHIRGKISQANARPTCPRVPCSLPMCRVSTYTGRTEEWYICRQANLVLMVCCSLLCSGLEYTAQANLVLMVIVRTPAHPLKPTLHTFCPKRLSWARFNLALSSLYYFSFTEYFIEWAMSKHNTNNVYFIFGTRFWSALIHCNAWLKEPCFIFSATCWFLHMFMHSAFCSCDTACARHFAQFCTILQDILQSFTRELAHMQSAHASGRANS